MLKVGIVGLGFMGQTHLKNWQMVDNAKVTTICDANPKAIESFFKDPESYNYTGKLPKLSDLEIYHDFDQMLANGDLDAISITLPTNFHPSFTVKAMEFGLHVLCEKPMALTPELCQEMIQSAEKTGQKLMIAHCIRFWPEYVKAKEIVDSGEYGKVIAGNFRRIGAPPTWAPDNWFKDAARSGGMTMDLHIHDSDYIQQLFGMPKAVQSFGNHVDHGEVDHLLTHYHYDEPKLVTAEASWAMSDSFGFEMSFNIVMEKATIVYDCTRDPAFKVCPSGEEVFTPEIRQADGYIQQTEHFVKLITNKNTPNICTPTDAMNSIKLVLAEKESFRSGNKVNLD